MGVPQVGEPGGQQVASHRDPPLGHPGQTHGRVRARRSGLLQGQVHQTPRHPSVPVCRRGTDGLEFCHHRLFHRRDGGQGLHRQLGLRCGGLQGTQMEVDITGNLPLRRTEEAEIVVRAVENGGKAASGIQIFPHALAAQRRDLIQIGLCQRLNGQGLFPLSGGINVQPQGDG